MEDSSQEASARPVRRVRCPRCHSILQEPGAPIYQCGGCGTSLRAKNRAGSASGGALPPRTGHHLDVASTSRSGTPGPTTPPDARSSTDATGGRHDAASTSSASGAVTTTGGRRQGSLVSARRRGSGDGASTSSSSTPDATAVSRRQGTDETNPGDLVSARNRVSDQVALIERRAHDESGAASERRGPRDAAGGAEHGAPSPAGASAVRFSGGRKEEAAAASEPLHDDSAEEKRVKRHAESTDESTKKHSGEAAAQPQYHRRREAPPMNAAAPAAAAGEKAHHEVQAQNLGPLRKKILQTVDELKGDLSELFRKSPELNTPRARPPRRPNSKQEGGYASHAAVASGLPATPRHAAGHLRGSAARAAKPARVAAPPPRGLPSRRYRQCRADPCGHSAQQPRSCHHGCRRHHGKPECSSCRGYCCRPRAQQEPPAPRKPVPAAEARRRPPPRNHCRPVLKGAPFIVCSSCFKLVQVPADFAVATKTVRKLRCGSCSSVLSYSYRDPARKKAYQQCSTSADGSEPEPELLRGGNPDPFAPFVDGFGLSSYSTDDEQPLHVSRNTSFSFDTIDGTKGAGRLHRLMGYGSASELLRQRHSPDLYESFSDRTTPDVMYDRKGKSVCIDDDGGGYGYDFDDSDDEDGGALKRSAPRGPGWKLPWTLGKGTPGAIRIK
ncbi:hypothetical protein BS78_02G391700 [Paspalum vaginatum]|nr:hypothetical protein BS78_02G391700 [Paspalum vaginatum]